MTYKSKFSLKSFVITVLLLTVLLPQFGQSQFNIKIGYAGAYAFAPKSNDLIQLYNTQNQAILNEKMSSFHWLHGIDMGLRYRFNPVNIEISWESKGNVLSSVELTNQTATEKSLYYRMNSVSLGTEFQTGIIGFGATIEQGFNKIETDLTGTTKRKQLASSNPLNSKFFISFHIPGTELMSFVIRPYISFQWNEALELNDVAGYLNVFQANDNEEKFRQIGLSFCFL
ncbi:MAG TPA: hypothetical protein DCQ58_08095, partial [Saprospirales bacterium]|nr:hypothetical protein [Saprospirales bacterium]